MIRLVISPRARQDIWELLAWSQRRFGSPSRTRYRRLIESAFDDLRIDPERIGVKVRDDLAADIRFFHLRHSRGLRTDRDRVSAPRHFIVFRRMPDRIEIVRVLHDAMDFASRL